MRHIFIVNPVAGRRKDSAAVIRKIENACHRHGLEYDIYLTSHPDHASEIVRTAARMHEGRDLTFYACGISGMLMAQPPRTDAEKETLVNQLYWLLFQNPWGHILHS